MTIVAYGFGVNSTLTSGGGGGSTFQFKPRTQVVARYMSRRIKQAIYKLKRMYGNTIFLYTQGDPTTDPKTGERLWPGRQVCTIPRAIVLPVKISREQVQTISMISADKQFVYGGTFDQGKRWFYIDPVDLPPGFQIKKDYWLVYRDKKYQIKTATDNEFDSLWEILAVELEGVVPEQIHNLTGHSVLGFSQLASGVL